MPSLWPVFHPLVKSLFLLYYSLHILTPMFPDFCLVFFFFSLSLYMLSHKNKRVHKEHQILKASSHELIYSFSSVFITRGEPRKKPEDDPKSHITGMGNLLSQAVMSIWTHVWIHQLLRAFCHDIIWNHPSSCSWKREYVHLTHLQ